MLTDALLLVGGIRSGKPCEVAAARHWLQAEDEQVGGFGWCCAVLGLEAEAVRRALVQPERRPA